MKKTITPAFFIASIFLASFITAQPIKSYKFEEMLATADEQMELGDYFNASEWYKNIYKEAKSDDVALSIGYTYYKMRDFENAERWYSRVLDKDEDNIFVNDRYAYGKVLRALGQITKARQQFELFLDLADDEVLRKLARNELNGMNIAADFDPNMDVVVAFADEKINSGSGEYSPVEYDENTLYYGSFNRRREIVLDGKEKDFNAKIYKTEKSKDGFGKPEPLDNRINRDGFHMSNVCFSDDRRRMFFTRQQLQNDEVISSTIYASYLGDDDWGTPEPIPGVNGAFKSMQPATGELFGEDVLFFVSDMDGGYGGLDIYYAGIQGDGFGSPVNLGETINTSEDDIAPFYNDGMLYFSTEARPGLGGYDIYKSEWDGQNWSEPVNMGDNYNTRFDDFHISMNAEGTRGYLVSNRPHEKKKKLKSETCCYDIFTFEIRELVIDLLVGVGTEDEKPLEGATVELSDLTTLNPSQFQTQEEEYRFNFPLNSERKYKVVTSKEGYFPDTIEFNTYGILDDMTIRKKVLLKKKPDLPDVITEIVTINEPIRLNNIYYEFEKWDILPEAEIDLNVILGLMNEYPDMVIELSSHTDSRGTVPFNENLSQKRAESAKNWLVQKGIAEERIVAKGYGESVILNRCTNGVRCSDEEHRFNRRTEFKIIAGPQSIEIKREVKQSSEYKGGTQSLVILMPSVPVITFDKNNLDLGRMKAGEKRELVYSFTNTGDEPLLIELATSCKCTSLDWPKGPIPPGKKGFIKATFDSTGMSGKVEKTIDIIANTQPIVVEAKFYVVIDP